MRFEDINKKINELKLNFESVHTNYYLANIDENSICNYYENEAAILFGVNEPNKIKYFYYYADWKCLLELLDKMPRGSVLEIISKDAILAGDDDFIKNGFKLYAKYIRITSWWNSNPYDFPEEGRRGILQKLYDPNRGEFATVEDVEELYNINSETFDKICDDVFTIEQWKEIVGRKNCIVYKEDGEIVALYVWRLEGKKLYSNMSINKGPANYLYDMERRIFSQYWDQGIRVSYAWFNIKNNTAMSRGNNKMSEFLKRQELLYNHIYIKE